MSGTRYDSTHINDFVRAFLEGTVDIVPFKNEMDEHEEIYDFLQDIIDNIKKKNGEIRPYPFPHPAIPGGVLLSTDTIEYLLVPESYPGLLYGCPPSHESVRQLLNYEFRRSTHNVRTASGALNFFNQVLVIYYQISQDIHPTRRYSEAHGFALDVIPQYLSGGEAEMYIQREIIPLFPDTMKKTERKKAVKAKIKEEFKSEKGYPGWVQSSDWPIGANGKPMTYVKKGKRDGSKHSWIFRDESNGEITVVEQFD
mgnify:FL=1